MQNTWDYVQKLQVYVVVTNWFLVL